MKKTVLLTRPWAASQRLGKQLVQHGFDYVIEPLLTIKPTQSHCPDGFFDAVMITSANALDAMAERKSEIHDLLALPCFCVGAATGDAARAFGFSDVRYGASDSVELAHLIAAKFTGKSLLHICGDVVDSKAQDILAEKNFAMIRWIAYQAIAAEDFTPEASALFASRNIAAVPVFSPRSAQILVSLIEKNNLVPACSTITAVGLSQAVADVLQILPWRRVCVAAQPSEEKILACLQTEFS